MRYHVNTLNESNDDNNDKWLDTEEAINHVVNKWGLTREEAIEALIYFRKDCPGGWYDPKRTH